MQRDMWGVERGGEKKGGGGSWASSKNIVLKDNYGWSSGGDPINGFPYGLAGASTCLCSPLTVTHIVYMKS